MTVVQFRSPDPLSQLTLPAGRMRGRMWVSDEELAVPELYLACVAAYPRTGHWPVLIPRDARFELTGEDWIEDRGWLPPAADEIHLNDPRDTLAAWWPEPCCDGHCLDPYGAAFPGLARRSPSRADPLAEAGNTGSVIASHGQCRLGLVEAARPADVPAALGWQGMRTMTDRVAALSAVLRSWEERFGAVLIGLGFDTLDLSVAAPPKTRERSLAVAAEHRAFCPDEFSAQPGTLREFAAGLTGRRLWRFWWD
ncbi:DUF4253 domain-containing protein [Prauserella muralis]|uniref:Uncharacterized protein n=1 Tax=Prauserella muralis TaxID=588067 RepID=A0A2V4BA73_9PSEU|nr:DUF4253 domain-containing protein [Prauserella muralis]PXY31009.1 hypothetical protein BAY60_00850 [Prauserella muralis]TWE14724.1 uncharacterized protein DUF4253 [Prauserella muralis]